MVVAALAPAARVPGIPFSSLSTVDAATAAQLGLLTGAAIATAPKLNTTGEEIAQQYADSLADLWDNLTNSVYDQPAYTAEVQAIQAQQPSEQDLYDEGYTIAVGIGGPLNPPTTVTAWYNYLVNQARNTRPELFAHVGRITSFSPSGSRYNIGGVGYGRLGSTLPDDETFGVNELPLRNKIQPLELTIPVEVPVERPVETPQEVPIPVILPEPEPEVEEEEEAPAEIPTERPQTKPAVVPKPQEIPQEEEVEEDSPLEVPTPQPEEIPEETPKVIPDPLPNKDDDPETNPDETPTETPQEVPQPEPDREEAPNPQVEPSPNDDPLKKPDPLEKPNPDDDPARLPGTTPRDPNEPEPTEIQPSTPAQTPEVEETEEEELEEEKINLPVPVKTPQLIPDTGTGTGIIPGIDTGKVPNQPRQPTPDTGGGQQPPNKVPPQLTGDVPDEIPNGGNRNFQPTTPPNFEEGECQLNAQQFNELLCGNDCIQELQSKACTFTSGLITGNNCEGEPYFFPYAGEGFIGVQSQLTALTNLVTLLYERVCELEPVLAPPDHWQTRVGPRAQLVVLWKDKPTNGNDASYWSSTIPHYNKGEGFKPVFPSYVKGNYRGGLILSDNSKFIVYGNNQTEVLKVINYVKTLIDPAYLPGRLFLGESNGINMSTARVYPRRADFYSQGRKNAIPDWSISLE